MAGEKALAPELADQPQLTLIDSHCHIDMPENAKKPIKRPDSDGLLLRFDAGLTVRWIWERPVSGACVNSFRRSGGLRHQVWRHCGAGP
jgi:hypothetical protein